MAKSIDEEAATDIHPYTRTPASWSPTLPQSLSQNKREVSGSSNNIQHCVSSYQHILYSNNLSAQISFCLEELHHLKGFVAVSIPHSISRSTRPSTQEPQSLAKDPRQKHSVPIWLHSFLQVSFIAHCGTGVLKTTTSSLILVLRHGPWSSQ